MTMVMRASPFAAAACESEGRRSGGGHDPDSANPSRGRDHLANERTYLAWLRAAATVMIFGLAIAEFGDTSVFTVSAGAVLIAVGALGLIYGTARYRRVNDEIEHGQYITGSRGRGPALASAVLIIAVLVALTLLIAGEASGGGSGG
jgi:putative membrane protein